MKDEFELKIISTLIILYVEELKKYIYIFIDFYNSSCL